MSRVFLLLSGGGVFVFTWFIHVSKTAVLIKFFPIYRLFLIFDGSFFGGTLQNKAIRNFLDDWSFFIAGCNLCGWTWGVLRGLLVSGWTFWRACTSTQRLLGVANHESQFVFSFLIDFVSLCCRWLSGLCFFYITTLQAYQAQGCTSHKETRIFALAIKVTLLTSSFIFRFHVLGIPFYFLRRDLFCH